MDQLIDTWQINNRINLYLINAIEESSFGFTSASKGRTVGEQLAHIHNVRLMWLNAAMPELMSAVKKIEKENIIKALIIDQYNKSAEAISQVINRGLAEGKIKNFRPHPVAFVGYLISHEGHHRGQVILSLKQAGHPLDKKILYGIWEWGSR